jgi:5-methylcytosine-specific restriction enzyme subunit McrC
MVLFEHERLRVGEGLGQDQFDAIARWKERTGHPALELGHRGFRTTHWVGVLQVGSLLIEILPKAEADRGTMEGGRDRLACKWRWILLQMVATLRGMRLDLDRTAWLRLQQHSILELFFHAFLSEAQALVREGLLRSYRMVRKDRGAVRGRILVQEDLRRNLVHRERIHCEALEFDASNAWNRILVEALREVESRSTLSSLRVAARSLLLPFQEWPRWEGCRRAFPSLAYDRRTERYRKAMDLARLILMAANPDLGKGRNEVFALLFDMNALWESWLTERLQRETSNSGWRLIPQKNAIFWRSSRSTKKWIRPDLLLHPPVDWGGQEMTFLGGTVVAKGKTVLDAKWKVPAKLSPSDEDLRQLYTYNLQFGCSAGWLVYPQVFGYPAISGRFAGSIPVEGGLAFVELPRPSMRGQG